MSQEKQRVSDGRQQHWFWLGNEIIDDYAAEMKPMALAVYVYLCRRADRAGKSWPSQRSMAEDLGIERGTARTAVKQLVKLKLLSVEVRRNEDGSHKSTLYTLLEPESKSVVGGGPIAQGGSFSPEENPEKEDVEEFTNVHSSSEPSDSPVALEKYITDRNYEAMREAKLRLDNASYSFHLGRAKDMLTKDSPTDEEIESLPGAFVTLFKWRGKADACSALVELRRQRARNEMSSGRSEGMHPHSEEAAKAKDKPRLAWWYVSVNGGTEEFWQRKIDAGATHSELVNTRAA